MSSSDGAVAQHGMDILMEMVAASEPLSRTALRARTALSTAKLEAGLKILTRGKVVCKERGPRGRYRLAMPASASSIGTLARLFQPACRRRRAADPAHNSPLAGLDPRLTLAELHGAVGVADKSICPYYDVCVALGGPEGPVIQSRCQRELAYERRAAR